MADATARFVLERPIPGFDHVRAFSQGELNTLVYEMPDFEAIGTATFAEFCVSHGGRLKWANAADGLRAARAIISVYERWLDSSNILGRDTPDGLRAKIDLLRRLELILDQADARDIRFVIRLKHST